MDETQALQLAREAIQQGNRATAQALLLQVIQTNSNSETGWLWLSAVVGDPVQERDCLKRVLAINPHNEIAQRHLAKLDQAPAPLSRLAPQPIAVSQTPPAAFQAPQETVFYHDELDAALLIIAGVLFLALGLVAEAQGTCGGLGAIMLIVGLVWLAMVKTTYHVRIGSASGESNVLEHRDAAYIAKIVKAMNEAIVNRG